MAINLLHRAEIYNSTDSVGMPRKELTREELLKIVGLRNGSVSVPSLTYTCFEASLHTPFYSKDFTMSVSAGTSIAYAYFKSDVYHKWYPVEVTKSDNTFYVDFNKVLPDQAQLVYKFRFVYVNLALGSSNIYGSQLLAVDYPVEFDYKRFSVVATSHENAPFEVSNHSVQKSDQDIRVLPVYSGDYEHDSVYVITASGKYDDDKYHLQRGWRFPEDAGWGTGRISDWYDTAQSGIVSTLREEGRGLTISGTAVSGTWTSPVVYLPDEDMITMYVYGDDLSDDSYITNDMQKIDSLVEARSSDQSPRPNFLVSSWTPRLYTFKAAEHQKTLSLPSRRHGYVGVQDSPSPTSSFWVGEKIVCAPIGVAAYPAPYVMGRSKRMYIKGDGSIIAQAPQEGDVESDWEYGHRGYQQGVPFKEYGDINEYWNVGHLIPLLGSSSRNSGCDLGRVTSPAKWHMMTFASESDQSDWALGREAWSKLKYVYPYYGHFSEEFTFGAILESLTFEPLGSYTFARPGHPNEWLNITGIMYPWNPNAAKYMCLYYTHVRNFWPSESKLLGVYGIGEAPCDEGWAMCKSKNGGFWLHVGYTSRVMKRYDYKGDLVFSGRCNYSFNTIIETSDPDGLWCVRNDSAYWYSFDGEELVEVFSVTNPLFKYLQSGSIDSFNNLWVVDRDTSTVYRINFSSRSIDYEKEIPYTVAVWPHPRDGTAFLYSSFNADTFSTAINQIDVNDPYGYTEQISVLPELPISDYSGVQFMGRSMESYLKPAVNDPVWGTSDDITLEWDTYPNSSLTLPGGKYKQFRITLSRSDAETASPKLHKIRIPKSMVLSQVPYQESREVYINPHLRYNTKFGHFNTELVVWWPHQG